MNNKGAKKVDIRDIELGATTADNFANSTYALSDVIGKASHYNLTETKSIISLICLLTCLSYSAISYAQANTSNKAASKTAQKKPVIDFIAENSYITIQLLLTLGATTCLAASGTMKIGPITILNGHGIDAAGNTRAANILYLISNAIDVAKTLYSLITLLRDTSKSNTLNSINTILCISKNTLGLIRSALSSTLIIMSLSHNNLDSVHMVIAALVVTVLIAETVLSFLTHKKNDQAKPTGSSSASLSGKCDNEPETTIISPSSSIQQ